MSSARDSVIVVPPWWLVRAEPCERRSLDGAAEDVADLTIGAPGSLA
jgi:hypothetical protein